MENMEKNKYREQRVNIENKEKERIHKENKQK